MDDFRKVGRRLSNWGRWGALDRLGTLNHITPEAVVRASRLIRRGQSFDLSIPLGKTGPAIGKGGRINPVHLMSITPEDTDFFQKAIIPGETIVSDDWVTLPLQCGTHWDGLAHVGYDGCFYNDVPASSVTPMRCSSILSIESMIERGPTGRGVLLDITALRGRTLEIGEEVTIADLEACEQCQGIRVEPGDILLIRTGWIHQFTRLGSAENFWRGEPGIGLACADWLHRREVAAIAADNFGVEVVPPDEKMLMECHCVLIRDLGMSFGEIFNLDALAADCARDQIWEFFFTAAPLKVEGAVGSPITPLAIK
jgi:kynurenine formamidase